MSAVTSSGPKAAYSKQDGEKLLRKKFMGSAHFLRTPSRGGAQSRTSKTFLTELSNEISQINPELVQELERIAKGKPEIATVVQPSKPADIYNDKDYDTDLEYDEEEYCEPDYAKTEKHDTTGSLHYIRRCEEMGVVPVQYFLRHHEEPKFVMRYHGLGSRGAQALSIPLEKNTHISQLNLEGNDIESEGVVSLCKMLSENLYITELNLAENSITSQGAACVCELLSNSNRIHSLDLSGNSFTDHDAQLFSDMLQKNTTLKQLFLSYNKFGDSSGQAFKDALTNNDTLHLLDLSWNLFRTQGAVMISDGVRENVGLKTLNLRMNGFGTEGAKAMAHALMHNRTLLELDLSANRIPLQGAVALGKGINCNECLVTIKLGHNPITAAGAVCILAAVGGNENSEVQTLDLSDVYVNPEFMSMKTTVTAARKDLVVIHGSMEAEFKKKFRIEWGINMTKLDKKEHLKNLLMKNPITKIKQYMNSAGLRLIDFFKQLDKDQSNSLTFEELQAGCERYKIQLSDAEIYKTIKLLDTDKSGDIDFQSKEERHVTFRELVTGDKEHKLMRRAMLKEIALIEEQEKEKIAARQAAGENVEDLNFESLSREEAWEAMEEVLDEFMEDFQIS